MQACRERVELALKARLPSEDTEPVRLHRAMRYAALAPGKRLRPSLVYATGSALGLAPDVLDAPACAIELIHAYSLVHDDLPAMDDDDLRRGRPTCHKAFDEATAILTGDALQTQAFSVLADAVEIEPGQRLKMVSVMAKASGSLGMAGGQALDLAAEGLNLPLDSVQRIHERKTGSLIRASVLLGALSLPGLDDPTRDALSSYGEKIGLAFQIRDDILDVEGDTGLMGKQQGADIQKHKLTYPSILGLDNAKAQARQTYVEAMESLDVLGDSAMMLKKISDFIIHRSH